MKRTVSFLILLVLCVTCDALYARKDVSSKNQSASVKKKGKCGKFKLLPEVEEQKIGRSFEVITKDGISLTLVSCLAQEDDLPQIVDLYDCMSAEDRKLVITFPEPFRTQFLQESIKKQHLFIARDANKKVIAVLKVFLVKEQEMLDHMLSNELRILPSSVLAAPYVREARFFNITKFDVTNYVVPLKYVSFERSLEFKHDDWLASKNAAIYCGSCYAREEYRGLGIGSKLEAFAFDLVRPQVLSQIQNGGVSRVCLLFGKVEQTYKHQGLLRSFISFIFDTPRIIQGRKKIYLWAWSFKANLPIFDLDAYGALTEICKPTDQWTDYGCVFVYDLATGSDFSFNVE
jgi:GNAT superfamily N-acetyltransferase